MKIRDLFTEKLHVIGLAALAIAVIMVRMNTHMHNYRLVLGITKDSCVCNCSLLCA